MLELILDYRDEAQRLASIALLLAAWRWGGAPERAIALTFFGFLTVPLALLDYLTVGSVMLSERGYLVVIIDFLACAFFVAIALNANRNYTLWIAGFQLVSVFAHVVRTVGDVVSPIAYAFMVIGPSYFQLALIVIGLIRHIRRKKRYGEYRDWRVPWHLPLISRPIADGPRANV